MSWILDEMEGELPGGNGKFCSRQCNYNDDFHCSLKLKDNECVLPQDNFKLKKKK